MQCQRSRKPMKIKKFPIFTRMDKNCPKETWPN